MEEQVRDNKAWYLLLFAVVDELVSHNLRYSTIIRFSKSSSLEVWLIMSVLQLKPEVHLWPLFPPSPLALSPRGSQCCCLADVEGAWKVLFLIFCFQLGVVTCLRSLQLRPWMVWTHGTPPLKAMHANVKFLCMAMICVQWWICLRFGYIVFVCLQNPYFDKHPLKTCETWTPYVLGCRGPLDLCYNANDVNLISKWLTTRKRNDESIWSSKFKFRVFDFFFFFLTPHIPQSGDPPGSTCRTKATLYYS